MAARDDPEVIRAKMEKARADLQARTLRNREKAAEARRLREKAVAAAEASKTAAKKAAKAAGRVSPKTLPKVSPKLPPPPVPSFHKGSASRTPTPSTEADHSRERNSAR